MAFLPQRLIEEETIASNSQTFRENLPKKGKLSDLKIRFRATNGATNNLDSEIWRVVQRITVKSSGMDPHYDMTGQAAARFQWLHYGRLDNYLISEEPDVQQFFTFDVPFGRFSGDPKYALDLSLLTNPQLEIQYNLAAVNAVGATGFVTGTTQLEVEAQIDETYSTGPVQGHRRMVSEKSFTSAASGNDETELDVDQKYLGIGAFMYERLVNPEATISDFVLRKGSGGQILADYETEHLIERNAREFKVDPTVRGRAFKSDTDNIETWTGDVTDYTLELEETTDQAADTFSILRAEASTAGDLEIDMSTADVTAGGESYVTNTTDDSIYWKAKGQGVGNCAFINFDKGRNMDQFLDTQGFGKLQLVLTQGNAGGTVDVFSERLMRL